MKKFFTWLRKSSADPRNTSLTIRMALLGLVPIILNIAQIACGFHLCLTVSHDGLTQIVEAIANIVFYVLSVVSAIGFAYGLIRKLYLTAIGKNKAI